MEETKAVHLWKQGNVHIPAYVQYKAVCSLEHVVTALAFFSTMQIKSSKFKYAICIKLFKYYAQLVKNENKLPLFKFLDSKFLLMVL
jgi:hypothetical protein